ncbi:MAG: Gfo/Idh/MocA family oxidoreductase [Opitutaceae bacterium]|jgi:predicted dehydrogenase|nr:Gfo/Idh/MocA family oxidoreductase [Opitutaceae bacterium]
METPLNIGFVGLGWGAHVAGMLASGPASRLFNVAAACDMDAQRLAEFAARHRVKTHAGLDALLADRDVPVIGLFSGPAGRAGLLRRIIRAGKDVMTTKPFELDPAAARGVLEEARALGRVIHVNSPPPEPPRYIGQILRWQRGHDLGRPVSCRGEMLASYHEKADGRWLDDPALCPAAPVFRIGIYTLNDLLRLFGPVAAVSVMGSRVRTGRPTPDNAQLGLLFANGALGSVHASFCVDDGQHYANALTLHYERGTITRNILPAAYGRAEWRTQLRLVATRKTAGPDGRGGAEVFTEDWESDEASGSYEWQAFHDAITGRRTIAMPVDEIVGATAVVAAMARAERSGAVERVVVP